MLDDERAISFDSATDCMEFVIDTRPRPGAAGLVCGHAVEVGRSCRLYRLRGAAGDERGYLIGWLFAPELGPGLVPAGAVPAPRHGQAYEDWARNFSGKFVCYLAGTEGGSFHLDATGSLGVVYDPSDGMLASVPDLLPSVARQASPAFDAAREAALGPIGHFGFGETSVPGIRRLLPNFALDARTFVQTRIWPTADATDGNHDLARTRRIYEAVRTAVAVGVGDAPGALHLTAGTDTRMVLAAAWDWRHELPFFTIAPAVGGRSLDADIAGRLAARFGLEHFLIATGPLAATRRRELLRRTGFCVADGAFEAAAISELLEGQWHFVGGVGGEIGRAFYWNRHDIGAPRPTARELVARTGVVTGPDTLRAAAAWLAGLPDLPTPTIWDLAYLEIRAGHWAGALTYVFRGARPTMSAFNSFAAVREMLALGAEYRASGAYVRDFLALADPALITVPLNRRSGLRALADPRALVKQWLPLAARRRLAGALRAARRHHMAAATPERLLH
jgi:hypothetical protein